jgi:CO/xanthine dehydrogenase FAD-binding subunit
MIVEYSRPTHLDEAIGLLTRKTPKTFPLGGGTRLRNKNLGDIAVVDLQALGLDRIQASGVNLDIGATVKLQALLNHPKTPSALQKALVNLGGLNLRNQASVAGEIVSCDGRSALITGMLAMNAHLIWLPGEKKVSLGDYLALRGNWDGGALIGSVELPLNGTLSLEIAARTPLDQPILCVAICRWPSGRTRVALGGYGKSPILAMDGPEAGGAEMAVQNAYLHAEDKWASGEYRSRAAAALLRQMIGGKIGG